MMPPPAHHRHYPSGGYSSVTPPNTTSTTQPRWTAPLWRTRRGGWPRLHGTSKTTDLGFSYTNRGEPPLSISQPALGRYYHVRPHTGRRKACWIRSTPTCPASLPGLHAGGRGPGQHRVGVRCQNPVTATSYNGFSEAKELPSVRQTPDPSPTTSKPDADPIQGQCG